MTAARCESCAGRLDRPGLFRCRSDLHPAPDRAQRIVAAVERVLGDRGGMGWGAIDDFTLFEVRDALAAAVRGELAKPEVTGNHEE